MEECQPGADPVARRPKQWSLPVSIAVTAVLMPLVFKLRFGFVDGFAWGFTGFLILMEVAVEVLPRYADKGERAPPPKVRPGRLDFLGVIWLLSIPFAPLAGWALSSAFDVGVSNWRVLLTAHALLCIALPVVCVLPLFRYVRHPYAAFGLTVLVLGTAFPVLTGLTAAADVVRGPAWQDVEITGFRDIAFRTPTTLVKVPDAFVELSDGRTLTRTEKVTLSLGPARVLVLRAKGRIIDVAP